MTPWLDDGDVRLYHGDALTVLAELPDASVDCVVTSPPYWGLRDYGTEGQLGLEATPDLFVANMVAVFREVRRVLADHGTCWVNLGDSYWNGGGEKRDGGHGFVDGGKPKLEAAKGALLQPKLDAVPGWKPKDLCGIPWRVALALQADGWWLRSDIIWAKPNPMPESVTDRPTKSHEYIFMLTKSPRYFFDQEAVREPHTPDGRKDTTVQGGNGSIQHRDGERWPNAGRNIRSVWNIATQPYPEAHFATFPEELARRCILAGTSERGKCGECRKPWVRDVREEPDDRVPYVTIGTGPKAAHSRSDGVDRPQKVLREDGRGGDLATKKRSTVGWSPSCSCTPRRSLYPTPIPCVVLDPFIGSGTVAKVARDHGRHSIGIDLNEQYLELAARRLQQLSLLTV